MGFCSKLPGNGVTKYTQSRTIVNKSVKLRLLISIRFIVSNEETARWANCQINSYVSTHEPYAAVEYARIKTDSPRDVRRCA